MFSAPYQILEAPRNQVESESSLSMLIFGNLTNIAEQVNAPIYFRVSDK